MKEDSTTAAEIVNHTGCTCNHHKEPDCPVHYPSVIKMAEVVYGNGCQNCLSQSSRIQSLEAKLKIAREALEVCEKESNNYYKGDEFTEANDHFRNIYLCSSNALSQLSL